MKTIIKTELATASHLTNDRIAIAGIEPEELVRGAKCRICTSDKVFVWVEIKHFADEVIVGRVTACHRQSRWGIKIDDLVEFKLENIVNPCKQAW